MDLNSASFFLLAWCWWTGLDWTGECVRSSRAINNTRHANFLPCRRRRRSPFIIVILSPERTLTLIVSLLPKRSIDLLIGSNHPPAGPNLSKYPCKQIEYRSPSIMICGRWWWTKEQNTHDGNYSIRYIRTTKHLFRCRPVRWETTTSTKSIIRSSLSSSSSSGLEFKEDDATETPIDQLNQSTTNDPNISNAWSITN